MKSCHTDHEQEILTCTVLSILKRTEYRNGKYSKNIKVKCHNSVSAFSKGPSSWYLQFCMRKLVRPRDKPVKLHFHSLKGVRGVIYIERIVNCSLLISTKIKDQHAISYFIGNFYFLDLRNKSILLKAMQPRINHKYTGSTYPSATATHSEEGIINEKGIIFNKSSV